MFEEHNTIIHHEHSWQRVRRREREGVQTYPTVNIHRDRGITELTLSSNLTTTQNETHIRGLYLRTFNF